jgi:GcrA cell cycle regulator
MTVVASQIWTEERVSRLKALWASGMSAALIAAQLGCFRDYGDGGRSAVIGKINRLQLPPPKGKKMRRRQYPSREAAPTELSSTAPPARPGKIASISRSFAGTISARPQNGGLDAVNAVRRVERLATSPGLAERFFDGEAPDGAGVQLLDLTDLNCHWPIGDPLNSDFQFCGDSAISGMPYCAHHCRISYQPAPDRRRAHPRV